VTKEYEAISIVIMAIGEGYQIKILFMAIQAAQLATAAAMAEARIIAVGSAPNLRAKSSGRSSAMQGPRSRHVTRLNKLSSQRRSLFRCTFRRGKHLVLSYQVSLLPQAYLRRHAAV
jgi:hypothetical protein